MADIFLSYNEKDRATVRRLATLLVQVGWSVWWDRRIPAGLTWRRVLAQELQSMRCMVVLWSATSVHSEWVCEEAAEGRALDKLVPVVIEAVRPPAGFREIQAADLVGWDGSRDFVGLQRLLEDIERLIGPPQRGAGVALAGALAGALADGPPPAALPTGPVVTTKAAPVAASQTVAECASAPPTVTGSGGETPGATVAATDTAPGTASHTATETATGAPTAPAPAPAPATATTATPLRRLSAGQRPAWLAWGAVAVVVLAAGAAYLGPKWPRVPPAARDGAALPGLPPSVAPVERPAAASALTFDASAAAAASAVDTTAAAAAAAATAAAAAARLAPAPPGPAAKPRPVGSASASTRARCASLTERQALGETLSGASQLFLDKECRP